jgi:predicted porin
MEYYLNKADDGEFASSGIDEKTWRIRPRIRYDFTRNVFIEASYYFTEVKDDEDNTNQKRNQFFIKISMACPLFE